MKEFLLHFFGEGSEQEFKMFGFSHFAPILVTVAIIFLIYFFREKIKNCKHEMKFRYAIAFVLIISEMSYYWRLVANPALNPNPVENLPISVCGWMAIFCSYMVVGKSKTFFDISYFWLFSGTIFALITPTVITYTGPTRIRYYQFWAEHNTGYIAIFYMIFIHGFRPTIKSAIKSYGSLAILAIIAYVANQMIGNGANYLFMARPESAPSILDILPSNFAIRLLIMASGISVLYVLSYLPWYIKDRKAKKSNAC